jgi:hypothetical protein
MGQVAPTDSRSSGLNAGGGHGLWRRDRHGVVGLCHGGNTVGFRGMLCVFPEQKKGFFVMVNADSETADYGRLDQLMITTLGIEKAQALEPLPVKNGGDFQQWLGWYQPVSFGFESFAYLDKLFGLSIVSELDGALQLSSLQRASVTLTALDDGLFSAIDRTTASHIFTLDEQGNSMLSSGFISYKKADILPLVLLWLSLAAGLLGALYIFVRLNAFKQPIGLAFLMYIGFLIPLPFLFSQSFLQLGDINMASVLLATVSTLSTLLCAGALVRQYRQKQNRLDALAIAAFLQWSLVLWYWGLLPLVLWRI